jgi:RNA polymerase sigma-70 factor (ECF subfamily)
MSNEPAKNSAASRDGRFATTHWSVVLSASRPESAHYHQALESLCRTYWFPLYVYLRRHGYDTDQAEDHTQAFLASLLEKHGLRLVEPKRGKFRSFLLVALKHFLANERARAGAQKRGGGLKALSLDCENAEAQYALEPRDELSPEKLYERSWAMTVLDRAMTRLCAEATAAAKKQEQFDCLKIYLTASEDTAAYRETAAKLGMTEGAVKVAVHRLRRRYRELLRDEIAQTVASEDEVDEEIRHLFDALAC